MSNQKSGNAELAAVLLAVSNQEAKVLTVDEGGVLPSGPLTPLHSSLQAGVRAWVKRQTAQPLGYIEQLYTFIDPHRGAKEGDFLIYISYLGLVREALEEQNSSAKWVDWYHFFPWEDHRQGRPEWIDQILLPLFDEWAKKGEESVRDVRQKRISLLWGRDGFTWNEEAILQRYELMYEVGLIPESLHYSQRRPLSTDYTGPLMRHDHRRVLASGIARLRAKIKYRPVIFELMPPTFTLLQLQQCMEAIGGVLLHKPNFRRMIMNQSLIEETGELDTTGVGRPAKLYRFREELMLERALTGSKLPLA